MFFDPKTMLVRDKKALKEDSEDHCIKDIIEKCGDGVNLFSEDGKGIKHKAFERAKEMFLNNRNYSSVIKREKIDSTNTSDTVMVKKEKIDSTNTTNIVTVKRRVTHHQVQPIQLQ